MSVLFITSVFGMLIKESYVSSAFTEPVNRGEHIFRNNLNIKKASTFSTQRLENNEEEKQRVRPHHKLHTMIHMTMNVPKC